MTLIQDPAEEKDHHGWTNICGALFGQSLICCLPWSTAEIMRLSAYRKWMVNLGSLENQHDWGVGNMGLKNGGFKGGGCSRGESILFLPPVVILLKSFILLNRQNGLIRAAHLQDVSWPSGIFWCTLCIATWILKIHHIKAKKLQI